MNSSNIKILKGEKLNIGQKPALLFKKQSKIYLYFILMKLEERFALPNQRSFSHEKIGSSPKSLKKYGDVNRSFGELMRGHKTGVVGGSPIVRKSIALRPIPQNKLNATPIITKSKLWYTTQNKNVIFINNIYRPQRAIQM